MNAGESIQTASDFGCVAFAALSLGMLRRELPLQNIGVVALIFAGIPFLSELWRRHFGSALGPFVEFPGRIDSGLLPALLFEIALPWLGFLVVSRGVSRWILRRWRPRANYGLWLLWLGAVLTAWMNLCWWTAAFDLHLFARGSTAFFYAWAVTFLTQAVALPWLLDKRRIELGSDVRPIFAWFALHSAFLILRWQRGFSPADGVLVLVSIALSGILLRSWLTAPTSAVSSFPA